MYWIYFVVINRIQLCHRNGPAMRFLCAWPRDMATGGCGNGGGASSGRCGILSQLLVWCMEMLKYETSNAVWGVIPALQNKSNRQSCPGCSSPRNPARPIYFAGPGTHFPGHGQFRPANRLLFLQWNERSFVHLPHLSRAQLPLWIPSAS